MNYATLIGVSALALATAACNVQVKTPTQLTGRLDCPTTQGKLTRVTASADGKQCLYRDASGADVDLRLVPVVGSVEATLASLERATFPAPTAVPAPVAAPAVPVASATTGATTSATEALAQAEADAAPADATPAEAPGPSTGHITFSAQSTDKDVVDMPGLHVEAEGDNARVNVGSIRIETDDEGRTHRGQQPVRLRGEALSREKRGFRAFLFTEPQTGAGANGASGYYAGGPNAGPIVVAVVRATDGFSRHGHLYNSIRRLVRDNGGV